MSKPKYIRIFEHMTKSAWAHVEDASGIGKLHFFAGKFKSGQGASLTLSHFVDSPKARVLLHDIINGDDLKFADYKGNAVDGGKFESRVMLVNSSRNQQDGRLNYYFEFRRGEGTPTKTGAVKPKGQALHVIKVMFTQEQAKAMAYAVLEYLQALAVANVMLQKLDEEEAPNESPQPQSVLFDDDPAGTDTPPEDHPYIYDDGETVSQDSRVRQIFDAMRDVLNATPADKAALERWFGGLSMEQKIDLDIWFAKPAQPVTNGAEPH